MVSHLLAVLLASAVWALQTPAPAEPKRPASEEKEAPAGPGIVLLAQEPAPTPAALGGLPLYPTADFLTSYDAGRGQRYYLFGCTASYRELIAYYRTILDTGGTEVYEAPPTYIFEVGQYDEDRMAFPPSVTLKDYTWNKSPGFLNPRPGATPERYSTIIQIVPAPQQSAPRR